MSKLHKMLDVTTQATDVDSDVIYPQHSYDEAGLYQVTCTAGTITDVFIYGRLGSDQTWEKIASSGAVTTSTGDSPEAGKGVKIAAITIYPQMYVTLDVNSSPSCVVTIME